MRHISWNVPPFSQNCKKKIPIFKLYSQNVWLFVQNQMPNNSFVCSENQTMVSDHQTSKSKTLLGIPVSKNENSVQDMQL